MVRALFDIVPMSFDIAAMPNGMRPVHLNGAAGPLHRGGVQEGGVSVILVLLWSR
ncbi:MAG: hypothetical protein JNL05_04625 [Flavobacteriales bacterium]|nr:hypothetical protein [Flavobacteriales bacterium]